MHQALLIDEILQEIFDLCHDHSRGALVQIAKTCKAWKEPGLDLLWKRLASVAPLLSLIPGISYVDGLYVFEPERPHHNLDLTVFSSYACRVRHITHRQNVKMDPLVLSRLTSCVDAVAFLPYLWSVQFSSSNCTTLYTSLSLSTALRQVDMDLGFKNIASAHASVCDYLEHVARVAPGLEKLILRGTSSARLNSAVASMTQLRSLSLRMSSSLTMDTIRAASTFPLLSELEFHGEHLVFDEATESWLSDTGTFLFPSLQKLYIRAKPTFVQTLISKIHPDTLSSLHVEIVSQSSDSWRTILIAITANSSTTLQDLTIEHHIDTDDLDLDNPSATSTDTTSTDTNSIDRISLDSLTFDLLQPLSRLRSLRSLAFVTTFPPDLCDQDVEHMAKWWPELVRLDLGTLPNTDCLPSPWKPRLTPASLQSFADSSTKLEYLVLPLDIEAPTPTPPKSGHASQCKLRSLTLNAPAPPSPTAFAEYLSRLFTGLHDVDGLAEQEDNWIEVQNALRAIRSPI